MSYILTFLITLSSLAICFAQNKKTFQEIRKFKRYNDYIMITTAESPDSALATIFRLLQATNIPVALIQKSQHYLVTEFHSSDEYILRFHVRIKKSYEISKIFLRCEVRYDQVISEAYASIDLLFPRLAARFSHNKCFAMLYEFAAQYPNGKIKPKADMELDRWIPNGTKEIIITTGATKVENIKLILNMLNTYNLMSNAPRCDSVFTSSEFILSEAIDDESFDTELTIAFTVSDKIITMVGYETDESFLSAMIGGNIRWSSSKPIQYQDNHFLKIKAFRELLKASEHLGCFEVTYRNK